MQKKKEREKNQLAFSRSSCCSGGSSSKKKRWKLTVDFYFWLHIFFPPFLLLLPFSLRPSGDPAKKTMKLRSSFVNQSEPRSGHFYYDALLSPPRLKSIRCPWKTSLIKPGYHIITHVDIKIETLLRNVDWSSTTGQTVDWHTTGGQRFTSAWPDRQSHLFSFCYFLLFCFFRTVAKIFVRPELSNWGKEEEDREREWSVVCWAEEFGGHNSEGESRTGATREGKRCACRSHRLRPECEEMLVRLATVLFGGWPPPSSPPSFPGCWLLPINHVQFGHYPSYTSRRPQWAHRPAKSLGPFIDYYCHLFKSKLLPVFFSCNTRTVLLSKENNIK